MNILTDIIEWVKDKPTFWQIAIDRLIRNNDLTKTDLDELIDACKADIGLLKDKITPVNYKILSGYANSSIGNKSLALSRIYDIENINALSSDSILEFSLNGLTVVYGDNGAGKSSYVNILKHACNTRGHKSAINGNIFDPNSKGKDNKAKIEYTVDKANFSFSNLVNQDVNNTTLKGVDVFDTHSANNYIEGEDEIAFIPQGLFILEKFAKAIKSVETEISNELSQTELSKFSFSLLQLNPNTKAQLFINSINYRTKLDHLRNHSTYSQEKGKRIIELNKIIPKLKAIDPKKKIKNLQDKIQRYRIIEQKLQRIEDLFSERALDKIKSGLNDYVLANKTLKAATEKVFTDLPIEGVGSDTWKVLWESARAFFEKSCNEGDFPKTDKDSSCPLCLQPLSAEAKKRFIGFEDFVKDDVQKKHDVYLTQYNKVLQAIENISLDFEEQVPIIDELGESIKDFKTKLKGYILTLKNYNEYIVEFLKNKQEIKKITDINIQENAKDLITDQIKNLSQQIEKLKTQSIEKALQPLESELTELLDLKKLYDFKPKIAREIFRIKKVKLLNDCKKKCSTRSLTSLSNELTLKYISKNLKDSFKKELKSLGFRNIKVEAETKGKKGKQYHYLRLNEQNGNSISLKDILSEGEHRCISLATFLSELSISEHKSSIIFDDPVSSLDHKWRYKISKRITEESKNRQVIVFTHDITFLLMLQEHAEKLTCDLDIKSLTRKKTETGLIASNPPWDALMVKKRIGRLKDAQQQLAKIEKTETEEIYKDRAKLLYGKLRETWERFIEEIFLNGAIQRFGRTVQTQRLSKVVDLTNEDYNLVDTNMSKCSTYFTGHDTSGTLIEEMPDSDEFLEDVKVLEEYISTIRKRRK
ncbi:AAA family ATPase [Ancylomarina sp. 16SWW S1-10-2]|uniref:AAA family ATPase n=1 Tax=Ancylomarina sp. 16SWW S1-10-2 TaxID=2499681 RepID=UPI0012AE952F|nr:AAA family ATPase [Ancylomarina sp. 16SWW S1-10-2]MRT93656.1 ATP-binding protein [Ancylomarina sp. 16SWW S1-10-2]